MYQLDPTEVLIPMSDKMVDQVEHYRMLSDKMVSEYEALHSHGWTGPTADAMGIKIEELHHEQQTFLAEVERVAHGLGDFGKVHMENEETASHGAHSIDVAIRS